MCLDAQGGIKAERQPFVVGVVVKSCGLERGLRDVCSLNDWKRFSKALSRHHSYLPRFEVQVPLRATVFSIHSDVS